MDRRCNDLLRALLESFAGERFNHLNIELLTRVVFPKLDGIRKS